MISVKDKSTYHAGAFCMPLRGPMSVFFAEMAKRARKRAKYVFYYNYVTRFSTVSCLYSYYVGRDVFSTTLETQEQYQKEIY